LKSEVITFVVEAKFEDTKGVIRIRKSKKDRLCNGQKQRDKRIMHRKLKIDHQEPF